MKLWLGTFEGGGYCGWAQPGRAGIFLPTTHHAGLSAGQHLSDAFAQVNPLQKVPVLKDGDFILTERYPGPPGCWQTLQELSRPFIDERLKSSEVKGPRSNIPQRARAGPLAPACPRFQVTGMVGKASSLPVMWLLVRGFPGQGGTAEQGSSSPKGMPSGQT